MATHTRQNADIKIEDFDRVKQRPYSSYQTRSFSKTEIRLIGKRAQEELKRVLYDVHGDRPVFEYPVLNFDDQTKFEGVSLTLTRTYLFLLQITIKKLNV